MRLRVLSGLFVGFIALLGQSSVRKCAAANYSAPQAVQTLRQIAPRATLSQIRGVMPRGTIYGWDGQTQMGDWTWHVRHFRGARGTKKWEGVIVLANNRAKWARLRPAANVKQREQNLKTLTAWRPTDSVHSVLFFLGDADKDANAERIRRETLRYINRLNSVLGRPREKGYLSYGVGPGEQAWSAMWKLSQRRTLTFATMMALLDGDYRPALELTFPYSQMYQA